MEQEKIANNVIQKVKKWWQIICNPNYLLNFAADLEISPSIELQFPALPFFVNDRFTAIFSN